MADWPASALVPLSNPKKIGIAAFVIVKFFTNGLCIKTCTYLNI